ncbi:MAG: formate dehydrogenase accessory sulfurtransferase FdhD [Actinomycetota bacterium]
MATVEERPGGRPTERFRVVRVREGRAAEQPDTLAAEEPLEIRLGGESVAVTMRTPGHDAELAAGFLLGEGIIRQRDLSTVLECRSDEGDGGVADVELRPGASPSAGWQRNFYATSSCGICGKASIDAVRVSAPPIPAGLVVQRRVLEGLPDALRAAQRVFDRTGGLHAAGLFTPDGELEVLREDVGRHNAVDKVVGRAAMEGRLPLHERVLLVSGRSSFEIMQKALVAGIPVVAAVSAPSTLAVRLARESNMTLVGFLRPEGFNVYAGAGRILGL